MTANEITSRWRTPTGARLAQEVFDRLQTRRQLDDLGLGHHESLIDLRGIFVPAPERSNTLQYQGLTVQTLGGLIQFQSVELVNLDMSGGQLESLRFFNSKLTNSRFDGARCQDWRMWSTDVANCTFRSADLRKAVLGPWHEGKGNVFRHVNFGGANLGSIVCPAASFIDCDFGDAHLAKVDFQSTSFIRCRFAGRLEEVIFYDRGFKTGKPDPNPMEDVDFTDAELRWVEFRRLNLDGVLLPANRDHLVLSHYRCVLERAIGELKADADNWKALRGVLENRLKWAGPRQEKGVFNRLDLVEVAGEQGAEFAFQLLRRLELECARQ